VRRVALIALAAGVLAGTPAAASAASVEVMVVGKARTLQTPVEVRFKQQRVRVGGRTCTVAGATPLAALLGTRPKITLRDYGRCGRSVRDAGALFVTRVGPDSNRGQDGWVYKVGRRAGSIGAGDPAGRLRAGGRVVWFYCVHAGSGSCQRTLEVEPLASTVAPGGALRVRVRGFDDNGRGEPAAGAAVHLGDAVATAGSDGVATLTAPAGASGSLPLSADASGAVASFPRRVTVG
jgi:hypothetical protein